MHPFVGTTKQFISPCKIQELIKKLAEEPSYYFLRWTHKVSGMREEKPNDKDFPMLEGEMFSHKHELRWKLKHDNLYEILLLTIANKDDEFIPIGEEWKIEPNDKAKFPFYSYPAYGYRRNETRFPKEFIYPESLNVRHGEDKQNKSNKPKLGQRYFIDSKTSAVQFVALTLEGE
ncbi:MAG: hypothetical protein HC903_24235 [Methylacidiphilales bacterium]|nr:hypothetical protein [Candidatus Methylacidiphilales bacterium]NJR18363.1 hypothetical protein [Calothrix sp. CSU_2_0]